MDRMVSVSSNASDTFSKALTQEKTDPRGSADASVCPATAWGREWGTVARGEAKEPRTDLHIQNVLITNWMARILF